MRVLITAGPTREYLDPVRYLSNGSSGKMGYALAAASAAKGWTVDLVSGPVTLSAPTGTTLHRVVSAEDMLAACSALFPVCDLFIAVAAVADYRPKVRTSGKLKKTGDEMSLQLVPTVDILRTIAATKTERQTVVGFAAETNDIESYALRKMREKRCDWIVANDVGRPGIGMDSDDNAVVLMSASGARHAFGPAPKTAVASFILERVVSAQS